MFYCGRVAFTVFKHAILKAWGSASRAQRPLTTGMVRRQFPSLRGTTWRNNGRSAWKGSRFEHIYAFYAKITNIHGVKLKMSFIIVIKTDLSGFVVPMHSGLCEQYVKSLGIWLPVSHTPSCIGTTNPSRTGLNPLNIAILGWGNGLSPLQCWAIIWTYASVLLIGPLGTKFSEFCIKHNNIHSWQWIWKMSYSKWWPFCLGPAV